MNEIQKVASKRIEKLKRKREEIFEIDSGYDIKIPAKEIAIRTKSKSFYSGIFKELFDYCSNESIQVEFDSTFDRRYFYLYLTIPSLPTNSHIDLVEDSATVYREMIQKVIENSVTYQDHIKSIDIYIEKWLKIFKKYT